MTKYKCIKEVQATLMGRKTAESLGLVRDRTGTNERGYHVIYDNGTYESWTPAEPFEKGYVEIERSIQKEGYTYSDSII